MKLGIFGDSFAAHINHHYGESWITMLSQEFDADVYAKPGASGYWVYEQFLNNCEKYDKIIYIATYPLRLSLSFGTVASIPHIEHLLKQKDNGWSGPQTEIMKAVKDYMLIAMTDTEIEKQHVLFYNMMLEKVKYSGHDILIIPAFTYRGVEFKNCLWDITQMEERAWGQEWKDYLKSRQQVRGDKRQCHLTLENNRRLYKMVSNTIETVQGVVVFNVDANQFSQPDSLENYKSTIKYGQ